MWLRFKLEVQHVNQSNLSLGRRRVNIRPKGYDFILEIEPDSELTMNNPSAGFAHFCFTQNIR